MSFRAPTSRIEPSVRTDVRNVVPTDVVRTASRLAVAIAAVALLAGCPRFHDGKLPGAPADATFVEIDGVHVRYRETGSGPTVVLIHGFGASSDSWLPVIPDLAAKHRVIAVDLKGFGWTSRPDGDYSPAAQAQLVWRVLDKLKVVDAAIVGHSWGTSVALAMAVAQPARVRRVALYAAYVYDEQVPGFFRWAELRGLGEVLFGLYYKERIDERAALAYYDERHVTQPRIERVKEDLARPGTVAAALAAARKHKFGELHAKLRGFAKPVLLLWGEQDQVTPLRFGHRLVAELATAELKTYPRCGHIPMVEAPQSTKDLAVFLAKDATIPAPTTPTTPPTNVEPTPVSIDRATDGGSSGRDGRRVGLDSARRASVDGGRAGGDGGRGAGLDGGRAVRPDGGGADGGSGGGGADGGTGGGVGGGEADGARADATITARSITLPTGSVEVNLPVGADLARIGAELTPRLYAAPRDKTELVIHGALRVRDAQFYNLDLDRGLDARGQPVFPVPLGGGQRLDALDLRARTDMAFYARGVGVAVKTRIDWLDNVSLGGDPDLSNGSPATSNGQRPTTIVIKRAWGEALTPFGTLAVGRMGAHFGLGMAANGGDCEDCDRGDAADRAAFVMPLAGHLIAAAYDLASSGPFTRSRDGGSSIGLEPSDRAAGPTLAILKVHAPATLARRADAGLSSIEYGGYITRRTQDRDVPASYLPVAPPMTFTGNDLVARGFSTTLTGGWLRASGKSFRFEAELAYARARLEQPSLVPGAEITTPVTSKQLGVAIESELIFGGSKIGVDGGFASGDSAPGFGAFPALGDGVPPPGSFDGAQANPPRDTTVDNFRFNPDYRVDLILFRQILGTVTDAIYIKPRVRTTLLSVGSGRLEAGASLIASWAVQAPSTPSGERALGVELDPDLRYASRDGFAITLQYGVLFPGAAFDNTMLDARPAQVLRARVGFAF